MPSLTHCRISSGSQKGTNHLTVAAEGGSCKCSPSIRILGVDIGTSLEQQL